MGFERRVGRRPVALDKPNPDAHTLAISYTSY